MIRDAEEKDISSIIEMSREFWSHSQFAGEEFQPEMVDGMTRKCMEDDLCLVYETDGLVVGFVCGIRGCLLANGDVPTGSEVAWWVNPKYRATKAGVGLLIAIENKAKSTGIKYWNMVFMRSSMPETIENIYNKMGYKIAETLYTKVL